MDCDESLIVVLVAAVLACLPAAASSPPWVSRIRRDHPRLFFNRDTWPAVRARAAGPERDWYGTLKARVDKCPDDPPKKEWGTESAAAAFVWLITRERRYLDKGTRLLRASVAWYNECTDSGRSVNWYSSSRINAWAALDWLWNDLSPEGRRELGASFLEHVRKVQPGSGLRLAPRWNRSGPETGFYGTQSLLWYSGLVLHGEGIDDARALDFVVRGHDLYQKLLEHRSRCSGDDGGSASASLNYCLGAYPWAEHNFFYSCLSATGEDIAPAWPHVASLTDYIFWNWLPGGREFGSGDAYHLNNRIGTAEVDGLWNATYYEYDRLNRLAVVVDPLDQKAGYGYDEVGNLAKEEDARARTTYYEYDEVGRKTSTEYEDGTLHYFHYDPVGNLSSTVDARGGAYFAYDKVNRMVTDDEPIVGSMYFEYDAVGNRAKVIDPDGGEGVYYYDEANRMVAVASPDAKVTYYEYDASGLVTRKRLGNLSASYLSYDSAGRLSSLRNVKSDGTPLSYFDYTRLPGGNISKVVRETGSAVYYTYDLADRLVDETWE